MDWSFVIRRELVWFAPRALLEDSAKLRTDAFSMKLVIPVPSGFKFAAE